MPPLYRFAQCAHAPRKCSEDRGLIVPTERGAVVIVADGAGGFSGGGRAADLVVDRAVAAASEPARRTSTAAFWASFLAAVDEEVADRLAGETTAIVIALSDIGLVGASVGDSEAWIVHDRGIDDLTRDQHMRPRIGSGRASPVGFSRTAVLGRLLVGTDGLFSYASREAIAESLRTTPFEDAAEVVARLARLPSGIMMDDLLLVVCERTTECEA
jgi:serine/threonine protein phosphatase PrpC